MIRVPGNRLKSFFRFGGLNRAKDFNRTSVLNFMNFEKALEIRLKSGINFNF
jgi:hypothetical protein